MKLILALFTGLLIILGACGPRTKGVATAVGGDAIDCGTKKVVELGTEYGPLVATALEHATTSENKIDVPTLDKALGSLSDVGWCVAEKEIARTLALLPSVGSEETRAQDAELRGALRELTVKHHAGKVFLLDGKPIVETK